MKKFTLYFLPILLLLLSCTSKKDKLSEEIFKLETSDSSSSASGLNNLADKYFEYYKNFPKDSISEIYLYKAFMYKYLLSKWEEAFNFSGEYVKSYGKTENFYNISLKKADIYNSKLKNIDSAVYYYLLCENKIHFSAHEYRNAASTLEIYAASKTQKDTILKAENLYYAAKFYQLCIDFEKAANLYLNIGSNFLKFDKSPQALSSSAFIFWNELKNAEKAKEVYKLLTQKYPESEEAKEALIILKENMLGMTDEQLAEYLINKNQQK
ncbi:MAG: hypothetical protein IT243_07680 [Bacteroidia bacterium]|nr:hypothetical protein [Bacteroidia bacterium]